MFQNNSHCSWRARIWELNCSLVVKISSQTVCNACLFPFVVVCIFDSYEVLILELYLKGEVLGKTFIPTQGSRCSDMQGKQSQDRKNTLHLYQHILRCVIPHNFWNYTGSHNHIFLNVRKPNEVRPLPQGQEEQLISVRGVWKISSSM